MYQYSLAVTSVIHTIINIVTKFSGATIIMCGTLVLQAKIALTLL